MLGFNYIKVDPTTYLMQFRRGKIKNKGNGLALWYYAPTTSLVAVPTGTIDLPFIFKDLTSDFQEVTVQGQLVYRMVDPEKIAGLMNFTLKPESSLESLVYASNDPEKLRARITSFAQVSMRAFIERLELRAALSASESLVQSVKETLASSDMLLDLGIELLDLSIIAIKPTPETARALEAAVREQLLEEADEAVYRRRNASIDQERKVKENELNTELAVETKHREIEEAKLRAERHLQEQRSQIVQEQLEADVLQEEKRQELVDLSSDNLRKEADAKAYEVGAMMEALSKVDSSVMEAMTLGNLNPKQLLAQAFRELANGANKIGQLNIAPETLEALAGKIRS